MERIWAEVNPRINYPVKAILVELMDSGDIDIDDSLQLFCISWITIRVLSVGVELFLKSWNNHPIPGICCSQGLLFWDYFRVDLFLQIKPRTRTLILKNVVRLHGYG